MFKLKNFNPKSINLFNDLLKRQQKVQHLLNQSNMSSSVEFRAERDSFGEILGKFKTLKQSNQSVSKLYSFKVPSNMYYGANTARSLIHFNIGGKSERMPVIILTIKTVKIIQMIC